MISTAFWKDGPVRKRDAPCRMGHDRADCWMMNSIRMSKAISTTRPHWLRARVFDFCLCPRQRDDDDCVRRWKGNREFGWRGYHSNDAKKTIPAVSQRVRLCHQSKVLPETPDLACRGERNERLSFGARRTVSPVRRWGSQDRDQTGSLPSPQEAPPRPRQSAYFSCVALLPQLAAQV